jgi:inner membrane protein YidH
MSAPEHRSSQESVRDHLSNERTYLAWLRTSLSIITFGIGLNRLGLYLNQLTVGGGHDVPRTGTARLGIGMIAVGMGLLVWGVVRYEHARRQIDSQDFRAARLSPWIVTIAILVLSGITVYLLMP